MTVATSISYTLCSSIDYKELSNRDPEFNLRSLAFSFMLLILVKRAIITHFSLIIPHFQTNFKVFSLVHKVSSNKIYFESLKKKG